MRAFDSKWGDGRNGAPVVDAEHAAFTAHASEVAEQQEDGKYADIARSCWMTACSSGN